MATSRREGTLSRMTIVDATWRTRLALNAEAPLVHNITNLVAMDLAANVLLAVGASPVMAHARDEVADMVGLAGALTINIGTLDPDWVEAMHLAVDRARELDKPWILDPVGAGATPYRNRVLKELLAKQPTVIRGNGSEILALKGKAAARGVDSANASVEALDAARSLARKTGGIVAVTGAVDYVTDGQRLAAVANGHPLMGRVTATGCALTALVGAAVAVTGEPFDGTLHALAIYGVAGELAALQADGPGTFRAHFLDALHKFDRASLAERLRVE